MSETDRRERYATALYRTLGYSAERHPWSGLSPRRGARSGTPGPRPPWPWRTRRSRKLCARRTEPRLHPVAPPVRPCRIPAAEARSHRGRRSSGSARTGSATAVAPGFGHPPPFGAPRPRPPPSEPSARPASLRPAPCALLRKTHTAKFIISSLASCPATKRPAPRRPGEVARPARARRPGCSPSLPCTDARRRFRVFRAHGRAGDPPVEAGIDRRRRGRRPHGRPGRGRVRQVAHGRLRRPRLPVLPGPRRHRAGVRRRDEPGPAGPCRRRPRRRPGGRADRPVPGLRPQGGTGAGEGGLVLGHRQCRPPVRRRPRSPRTRPGEGARRGTAGEHRTRPRHLRRNVPGHPHGRGGRQRRGQPRDGGRRPRRTSYWPSPSPYPSSWCCSWSSSAPWSPRCCRC